MLDLERSRSKNIFSSWLILAFFISLALMAIASEVFQFTPNARVEKGLFSNPVRSDIISNLQTITIKNRLGRVTLTKEDNGSWILKEPRVMPAKKTTIDKIIQSLNAIVVNNIHEYEPINLSSFSLNKPLLQIGLYTKLDDQLTLNFGLRNPINNTTYLTSSLQKNIFQIEAPTFKMESVELRDFIDSHVFSMDVSNIKKLELFRNNQASAYLIFERQSADKKWITNRYNTINQERTNKAITRLLKSPAHLILDEIDDKLQSTINNYFTKPLYSVKVYTFDSKVIVYKATSLVRSLPNINLEKRQNFIMTSSNRKYPYILNKKYLNYFLIRYSDLK